MKKLLVIMLAIVLAFGCFGGCSCGDDDEDDGKIKIIVGVQSDTAENSLMRKWKAEYEKTNPEIKIAIQNISGNYAQSMQQFEDAGKKAPDIIWTTGEQHAKWSDHGLFINLKSRIESDTSSDKIDFDNFYPEMVEMTHKNAIDDGIYFVPRDYNKCIIVINKKVFRDCGFTDVEIAGLKDDWGYTQFLTVCQRLRTAMDSDSRYGDKTKAVPLDARIDFNASYIPLLLQCGAKLIEDNGKVDYTSSANIEAYKAIHDLVDKGYIADELNRSAAAFDYVKAAMKVDVRPNIPNLPDTPEDYDIDFLPLPLDQVGVGCSGYAISKYAKERVSDSEFNTEKLTNEEYAYRFIKYIVSEAGQRVGSEIGSIIPVLKSLATDPCWTNYTNGTTIAATANHAAFVSYPEKDFNLKVYREFTPAHAQNIIDAWSAVMMQVIRTNNYSTEDPTCSALIAAINNIQNVGAIRQYEKAYVKAA